MIHVYHEEGRVTVWLDTEVGEKDGICLASEDTEEKAFATAHRELIDACKGVAGQRVAYATCAKQPPANN